MKTGGYEMANLSFLDDELNQLKEQGLFNTIRTIGSAKDA